MLYCVVLAVLCCVWHVVLCCVVCGSVVCVVVLCLVVFCVCGSIMYMLCVLGTGKIALYQVKNFLYLLVISFISILKYNEAPSQVKY